MAMTELKIKLYVALRRIWMTFYSKIRLMLKPAELGRVKAIVEPTSRMIEYPFVFKEIVQLKGGRILDVGCCGSYLLTELASLGFEVYGIDTRKYLVKYPNVDFIQGDIRSMPFQHNYFDTVIAVSTIEHIGTEEYGNLVEDPDGDKRAIKEISRILKPNGSLLITLPYGKSAHTRKTRFRIYNPLSLKQLIQGLNIESLNYYGKHGGYWIPVSKDKAGKIETINWSRAIVLAKLKKETVSN